MSRPNAKKWFARLAVVGLAVAGVQLAGTELASAHTQAVVGQAACESGGTYTVTWTVTNDYETVDSVVLSSVTPSGSSLSTQNLTLQPTGTNGDSATVVQSGIAAGSASATLVATGTWPDNTVVVSDGAVDLTNVCPRTPPKHAATAPTFSNGACVAGHVSRPTITIPADTGVTYTLDSKPTSAGVHTVSAGSHTVHATSTTLTLTGATSWTLRTSSAPGDCASVTPVLPSVTQSSCTGSTPTAPELTVPTTPGIIYAVSKNGPYTAGEKVIVTAMALTGHTLTSSLPAGWHALTSTMAQTTVQFGPSAACAKAVSVVTPRFTAETCTPGSQSTTAGSYTVPSSTGVTYQVGGKPSSAGTFTAPWGSKVTVVAVAKPGYTLQGSTVWSRTYPTQQQCAELAGVTASRTPSNGNGTASNGAAPVLASTGAPTVSLLVGGVGAILLGTGLIMLASRRRQDSSA